MTKGYGFQYGEQRDENNNITTNGSWSVKDSLKVSMPIIIENFRSLKEDGISTPSPHSHSLGVKLATTTNVVLSGLQIVDDVQTVDGDLILVKDQTDKTQNGIYRASPTAWTRLPYLALINSISNGSVWGGEILFLTTSDPITLGSSQINYSTSLGNQGLGEGTGIEITNRLISLTNTGIETGAYSKVVVDAQGRIVSGSNPSTIAEAGITDVYTKTEIDSSKAPISSPALLGTPTVNGKSIVVTDDERLSNARTPLSHNQSWSTITEKPTTASGFGLTDVPTKTEVANLDSSNLVTAKAYTDSKVASLVDSSPTTLDTLNELATALGNDANFSTTITNLIGTKSPKEHLHSFISLTDKPTTIDGFGITDVYDKTESDNKYSLDSHLHNWEEIGDKPSSLSGYGINDVYSKTQIDSTHNFSKNQIGTEETELGIEIKGKTLINLLGKDGNFEDSLTNWALTSEATVDSTTSKYGTKSLKISGNNSGSQVANKTVAVKANAYYIAALDAFGGGQSTWSAYGISKTITNGFNYVKIATTTDTLVIALFETGIINVDGIRLYEITLAEYNALGTTITDLETIGRMYPYCDSVQFKSNTLITNKNKNLIPAFDSGEWVLHANAVASGYGLTLNATVNYQQSYVSINVRPNTNYTFSCTHTGFVAVYNETGSTSVIDIGSRQSKVFNTGVYSNIRIYITNATVTAGTFTFINPQLELGSTATAFEPQIRTQAHSPIKLADTESMYVLPNGQSVFKQTWVKDVALTGDLAWLYEVKTTGVKRVYFPLINYGSLATKYNGNVLTNINSYPNMTPDNILSAYKSLIYATIGDADSGWLDSQIPTTAEIKAYFYGWKMCTSDGSTYVSGTKYWKKITDGTGITSTLPTASYAGYTPYTLHYKLATPVYHYNYVNSDTTKPILSNDSFLNIPIEQCQVEQSTGINWTTKTPYSNIFSSTIPLISVDNLTPTRDYTFVYNGTEQNVAYYQVNSKGLIDNYYTKAVSDGKYAPSGYGIGVNIGTTNALHVNLNTVYLGGHYYVWSDCTNKPSGFTEGYLDASSLTATYVTQTLTEITGAKYYRVCNNGIWEAWDKIATTDYPVFTTGVVIANKTWTGSQLSSKGFAILQGTNGETSLYNNGVSSIIIGTSGSLLPATDNAKSLGTSGYRWSNIWSANATIQTSDARQKNTIADSELGLDFINKIRPVSYKFNNGGNITTQEVDGQEEVIIEEAEFDDDGNEISPAKKELRDKYKTVITSVNGKRTHYGMIAQEVEKALAGRDFGGLIIDKETGDYGLRYEEFIAPMIKAIQELSLEVKELRAKLIEKEIL